MSSPARQMNTRRLPPLPGVNKKGSTSPKMAARFHQGTSPSYYKSPYAYNSAGRYNHLGQPDMVVKAAKHISSTRYSKSPNKPGMASKGHSPHAHLNGSHGGRGGEGKSTGEVKTPPDLHQDQVTSYLQDNPEFLEKYVLSHVSQDQLERWIIRRSHHQKQNKHKNSNDLSVSEEPNDDRRTSLSKWKFCVHADKRKMLQELTRDIHQHPNKAQVLNELTTCVASVVNADGYNLYLIDENSQELYCFNPNTNNNKTSSFSQRVGRGTCIAAYVAETKETVRINEILGDERFPEGVAINGEHAQSVLAQPITHSNGEVVGVVELYRTAGNPSFAEEDEEITSSYIIWGQVGVQCAEKSNAEEMYHSMTTQRKLNDFLLAVTKSIFQDIVSMDMVIMKIMNYAKTLVNADRASLFLLDPHSQELYARIFDTGNIDESEEAGLQCDKEIRFPMDKGIAGHVASTGETLNIPDAYQDERFNRDVDLQTGYTTTTILCMPILIKGSIIGVVQMVNKLHGTFNTSDEESFETFAVYCGLALHHAKLYEKIRRSEQKYKVALEVLSYHSQCSDQELGALKSKHLPEQMPEICSYQFSPWAIDGDNKPLVVIYMFQDLFRMQRNDQQKPIRDPDNEERFELDSLMRFTLTVRKNYRNVPYHNWAHAFSVAHAMFTVIKTTENTFTPLERLALFVACLCHDLDHRGKTNAFMVKSASPLAAIYSTSTMEHHHFNQTVTILQHDGHNIFKHLSSDEYKQVLGDIRHCILATDLALFFGNRAKLREIVDKNEFHWEEDEHRRLIMELCMTASDLCAMFKPWQMQKDVVHIIMEEFWQQGDEEKRQGQAPIRMMDRDFAHELPESQVGFIVGICLPCYELLALVMPETTPMVEGARDNLKRWKELAEKHKEDREAKEALEGKAEES
ncbi:probable 3',5'-cyclic phosphodiesterase pde-5 isoform X4 [Lineus longissimus]|uniref:probable 3',5'-cyclic phosphodiesterase pde-5 isoform X4 n=1 Tax=Lineus longissimus TaxID=88925 RepID=UPI00315DE32E